MAIKKGDTVKQIVHPIQGVVDGKRFNENSDKFEFLVTYTDQAGTETQRWFTEDEVEAA